jgi:hypothetical protein
MGMTKISWLMLHRTRHLFISQQTALINAIRAPQCRCRRQDTAA